jgi:small subunit ribosomal protein S16
MLKIRLKRLGRKKKVFYKVVVMENLSGRDGQAIDELGYYDPLKKIINLNKAKLVEYLNFGAYPTNTVRHLILNYIQKVNQIK